MRAQFRDNASVVVAPSICSSVDASNDNHEGFFGGLLVYVCAGCALSADCIFVRVADNWLNFSYLLVEESSKFLTVARTD